MLKHLLIPLAFLACPGFAQDSDKDYLTAFLEDSLSDAGREVTITGFAGALSSQATIDRLTIADQQGVWLTLEGVALDWSQSSLLSGELVVNELSARQLVVSRLPLTEDAGLPSPEAAGFSLPELPVSIGIAKLDIGLIDLAPEVLGQPVAGQLDAAFTLADGAGLARLDLTRTGDGPTGAIQLFAQYDNATGQLELTLNAGEDAGGLVATSLGLPGAPATSFQMAGAGPVDAFSARIKLATDGQDRLAGTVTVAGGEDGHRLEAELGGNLAPLFLPDYADFLGQRIDLEIKGQRARSGALTLELFHLQAASLLIDGSAMIAADGRPEHLALTGLVTNPDGGPVLLPLAGTPTRVTSATFDLSTSQEDGLNWTAVARLAGLDRADLAIDELTLSGSGRIDPEASVIAPLGSLTFLATGLVPADPALARAIGPRLSGKLDLGKQAEGLLLSDITLDGPGLSAAGDVLISGLDTGFLTSGTVALNVDDLSRLDAVTGLALKGAGSLRLAGSASRLSGVLDGTVALAAQDLQLGFASLDPMLAGASTASLSVLRDETGTTIRSLELKAGSLAAALSGKLQSTGNDLSGRISLADLAVLDPGYSGKASLDIALTGTADAMHLTLDGAAEGLATGNAPADRLLAGISHLTAELGLIQGVASIETLRLSNDQLDLSVTGAVTDAGLEAKVDGKLADIGLLVPDLTGPLTLSGSVAGDGSGYAVDLAGRGPGQVDAKISGTLARDFASAKLAITGTGQAGLANLFIAPRIIEGPARFDLALNGPLDLASLSGRLSLSDGRLSDPDLGFSFQDIAALADLTSGKAQISATARLSTGGKLRLDGPVDLTGAFAAELSVALDRVRFFDPKLYETVLTGQLGIKGPLAGGAMIAGQLILSETELRVPESGIDAAGLLLEIDHRNEPADVRTTRVHAGLLGGDSSTGGSAARPYRLDLVLSAPSRIFLRGRGIDAELGGELRLGGTTAAVVPAGEFSLIRGRLDILGKRLVLDTANLMLEGSFVPQLEISASTESDGIQSVVSIKGQADNPDVVFSSVPDLPQEEVLARLLFGRGLANISALQAAQLAQAVAVLAGRGGEGMVSRLRKSFGLDDLDVATAEDGTTAVKAGKYIAENIYTEVEIDQSGTSKINLNLDLRPGVTVKGRVGADGETGIGIYIEKDY